MKAQKMRVSLAARVTLYIVIVFLLLSAGLVSYSYHTGSRNADDFFSQRAQLAINYIFNYGGLSETVPYMLQVMESEEFQQVRRQALEANDPKILIEWMKTQPDYTGMLSDVEEYFVVLNEEEGAIPISLYFTYLEMRMSLEAVRSAFDVKSMYVQSDQDGVTYNIADPDEDVLFLGSVETPIPAFEGYEPNSSIPPIKYPWGDDWLFTVCEPIIASEDSPRAGEAVGLIGVDIDMGDVIAQRDHYFRGTLLFTLGLLALTVAAGVLLMRRVFVRPLHQLATETTHFAEGDEGWTEDDVISLDIRTNDEIGDLYHEIQSMQHRIVNSTERLTRVTAEREHVRTELNMAAKIQTSALPGVFPPFPDRPEFDLHASMDPAKEVGGDFYDFFLIDEDHLALVIADVSDKGVPAALFMMSTKGLLNYRARKGGSPGEILASVNAQICRDNTSAMFVTAWMGILEISTGTLTCANAGHKNPFIRGRDGAYHEFKDPHGLVIGGFGAARYTDYTVPLRPGDAVFVYTDGVVEATNPEEAFYGVERLDAALNRDAALCPEDMLRAVREDVSAFVAGARQFDDLSMLCLRYNGPRS